MSDVLSLIEKETGVVIDMKRRNSILAKIKEKAKDRFFTKGKKRYRILDSLRQMVAFEYPGQTQYLFDPGRLPHPGAC